MNLPPSKAGIGLGFGKEPERLISFGRMHWAFLSCSWQSQKMCH